MNQITKILLMGVLVLLNGCIQKGGVKPPDQDVAAKKSSEATSRNGRNLAYSQRILMLSNKMAAQQQKSPAWQPDGGFAYYKRVYVTSSDLREKQDAIIAIGRVYNADTVDFLIGALNDKEPRLRSEAARQLGNRSNQSKVVSVLIQALDDKADIVVIEAIEGLSSVRDGKVIRELTKTSKTHSNEVIREVAQDYAGRLVD